MIPRGLLTLGLRMTAKPALARMAHPHEMRHRLERDARFFRTPTGARFAPAEIQREGMPPLTGQWAELGTPRDGRAILHLHGGAYLAGSSNTHRHLGAALAGAAGARVLLPDYRRAPEHALPAAAEDALAAYRHLLAEGVPAEGLAVTGDSAGGGLAFALLQLIERDGLPPPAAIAAFSPWCDLTGRAGSLRANARRDCMLPARRLPDVVGLVLAGHDPADPLVSPRFADFASPPPSLILASSHEILADDATAMAETLRGAGGDATVEMSPRLPHAWPIFRGWLHAADAAVERTGAFLRAAFGD